LHLLFALLEDLDISHFTGVFKVCFRQLAGFLNQFCYP